MVSMHLTTILRFSRSQSLYQGVKFYFQSQQQRSMKRLTRNLKHPILGLYQSFYDPCNKKDSFLQTFGPITSGKEIKKRDLEVISEHTHWQTVQHK